MVYVYIYKESKTKVVQSDQNKILGCVQFCDYMKAIYNMILVSSIWKGKC